MVFPMSSDTTPDKITMLNATETAAIDTISASDSHGAVLSQTESLAEGQETDDRLAGHRSPPADREAGGNRDRVLGEGPKRNQDASRDDFKGRRKETSKEDQENAKKYVYSKYRKHAKAEDEELVKRWTETLNILLTFAGLQSAIVVAFITFQSPKLEPDPQNSTTYVLQQILHHLNNSTTLPVAPTINWTAPTAVVHFLAWWYLSLGCSLLSAFGALLSKQWVMHYQSQPAWANSDKSRAELRELRYQGLASWRFFAVIESLPVLLQLSLMFFAVGVIQYLKAVSSSLFIIPAILLGIGATFYIFTLVSGAFVPFCPYQSPVSYLLFRAAAYLFVVCLLSCSLVFAALILIMGKRSDSRDLVSLATGICLFALAYGPEKAFSKGSGELTRVNYMSAGSAGIFCWWLSDTICPVMEENGPEIGAIADVMFNSPAVDLVKTFHRAGTFALWLDDLQHVTADPTSETGKCSRASAQQPVNPEIADILFYFIHQSPLADYLSSIRWGHETRPKNLWEICRSIRATWPSRNPAEGLPVLTMRWSTVAVYLRYQLHDWCSGNDKKNHAEIIQQLPTLLEDPRLLENVADVANVASLAAVALVGDNVTGVCKREQLTQKGISKYEQLFLALHRLSFYDSPSDPPSDATAQMDSIQGNSTQSIDVILALLTKASLAPMRKMVDKPEKHRTRLHPSGELVKYPSLENGQLAETLLRLLGLGVHYRERAALLSPSERSPDRRGSEGSRGDEIITNVHAIVEILLDHWAKIPKAYLGGLLPLSSLEGLARILAAYTSKDRVALHHEGSLALLGQALGLRYYQPQSDSRFARHRNPSLSLEPHNPLPLSLLEENVGILPQLISDAREAGESDVEGSDGGYGSKRHLLLSTIVKGRDLFFMPDRYNKYSSLLQELTSYAQAMLQSGSFLELSPEVQVLLDGFQRWDELVEALTSIDALVKQTAEGEKVTGPLIAEDQGSGEIQALASTPVLIMPFTSSLV